MSSTLECIIVAVDDCGDKKAWNCRWILHEDDSGKLRIPGRILDLIAEPLEEVPTARLEGLWTSNSIFISHIDATQSSRRLVDSCPNVIESFLLDCLRHTQPNQQRQIGIQFFLTNSAGYVIRSDFVERRLEFTGLTKKVCTFLEPLQYVPNCVENNLNLERLRQWLESACGAALLDNAEPETQKAFHNIVQERLSIPWLSKTKIARKKLAVVMEAADLAPSARRWQAAKALGLDLILVSDKPCLDDSEQKLSEQTFSAFVSTDLTVDTWLPTRIKHALGSHAKSLDGIVAFTQDLLPAVAEAARTMDLWTSPPEAFRIANDKNLSRRKESNAKESFTISDEDFAPENIMEKARHLFPVVVKPTKGHQSIFVSKIANAEALIENVRTTLPFTSTKTILVEPYIEGPEVDANMILLDGKVVFCEIADDFPCAADTDHEGVTASFAETKIMTPSRLPTNELELLKTKFTRTILRQGFRDGIFHVEGRVKNSKMHYSKEEDFLFDLKFRQDRTDAEPYAFLHEVNARQAGNLCTASTLLSTGVDFYACQMLCAVEDFERYEALTKPFESSNRPHLLVANYITAVDQDFVRRNFPNTYLSTERASKMGDTLPHLQSRWQDSGIHVVQHAVSMGTAAYYGGKGWWWYGALLIASTQGREKLLRQSDEIALTYKQAVKAL